MGCAMGKFKLIFVHIILIIVLITGCSKEQVEINSEINSREWDMILDSADGTVVNLYHNMDDVDGRKWIEQNFVEKVKDATSINLKVTYKSEEDIFEKLINDRNSEITEGIIDIILLKDYGFKKFMEEELLYGDFATKLPNYYNNINRELRDTMYSDGMKLNGFGMPFGRNQLTYFYNTDVFDESPQSFDDLLNLISREKGRFTIPSPPNRTGVKFLETLAVTLDGWETVNEVSQDIEEAKIQLKKTVEYLTYIKPYLWKEGEIFPEDELQLDDLFKDDKVILSMNLDPDHGTKMMWEDEYPEGADSFIMESGTTGYTSYTMIPFNSLNKSGAMVVINYILSGEIQGLKYNVKTWGDLPVVDTGIMETEEAKLITKNIVKSTTLKQDEILGYRIPSVDKESLNVLVDIWFEIMN